MRLALLIFLALWTAPLSAREVVDASAPENIAVTVYRDPHRGERQPMNKDWPQGFAMISETRRVTLPAGRSTIRFTGVAEGMVAVSAIVTGLPGGTIEKNRNAELLSPAALVNGMLGNRVTITRTNPATGVAQSESAIVRTRADGGLVLQTGEGYEAVRCAGLPEKLTFPSVPSGLSAEPVFTIDTQDATGGTYEVTLSYLAWGFDWQAHYVATLDEPSTGRDVRLRLMSWLTLLNDNAQTFANAELMAVAGTLNVESDFAGLSDPPRAEPLRLTCYPFGRTASGSPIPRPYPAPPPAVGNFMYDEAHAVVVTGMRKSAVMEAAAPAAMMASEEALGDLKLYRVPERVNVNAQGLKQVAFLNKRDVKGRFLYVAQCKPWSTFGESGNDLAPADLLLVTKNDKAHGLGEALPQGGFTVFEPSRAGDLLVGEDSLRDYAVGQDVEVGLGQSSQVFGECARTSEIDPSPREAGKAPWVAMKLVLTNANPSRARVRVQLGLASQWEVRGLRNVGLKDGNRIIEIDVPANGNRELTFEARYSQ